MSLSSVLLELVALVAHMDFSVRSVTYFVLVLQLEDQDQSIDLQKSIVECFLELEVAVVLELWVSGAGVSPRPPRASLTS